MPVTLEAAEQDDLQGPSGILLQSFSQDGQGDVAVEVLRDNDDVGDRLAPRQLVGMVLVGPDEDDRSGVGRDVLREVVGVLELAGDAQAEDPDQLVDCSGAARSGEDDDCVLVAADGVPDDGSRVFTQPGRLQAGAGRLGVRVGVTGEHFVADEVLDERQGAAGSGVVGVGHPTRAIGTRQDLVVADDALADGAQQRAGHGDRIAPGFGFPSSHNPALCSPLPGDSARTVMFQGLKAVMTPINDRASAISVVGQSVGWAARAWWRATSAWLRRMQNSLSSGSARTTQPVPFGFR